MFGISLNLDFLYKQIGGHQTNLTKLTPGFLEIKQFLNKTYS